VKCFFFGYKLPHYSLFKKFQKRSSGIPADQLLGEVWTGKP